MLRNKGSKKRQGILDISFNKFNIGVNVKIRQILKEVKGKI